MQTHAQHNNINDRIEGKKRKRKDLLQITKAKLIMLQI